MIQLVFALYLISAAAPPQAPNDSYLAAVADAVLRAPDEVSNSLVAIDAKRSVKVVTWVRADELDGLKDRRNGAWLRRAPSDIWVTVAPKLKEFCQTFVKSRFASLEQLMLRLEQRLGLPPGSSKSAFVEIVIRDPSRTKNLFRPCANPAVTTNTCGVDPPADVIRERHRNWFYRQYYYSFGAAQSDRYPWTGLGYTFDWAGAEAGQSGFVEQGESEFVIPQGAAIRIESAVGTLDYCSTP